jgi:spoIIIJ-associated protein
MEWVETTGRSVEEAKEAALDELGVDEQDAEFEVVAEARIGLFGRVRAEARVRARVQPTAPRAKDDRRRKRRRPSDASESAGPTEVNASDVDVADDDAGQQVPAAVVDASDATAKPRRNRAPGAAPAGGRSRSGPSNTSPNRAQPVSTEPAATTDDGVETDSTTETPRPRRNRGGNRRPSEGRSEYNPAAAGSESSEEDGQVDVALEEQAKVAETFLHGLVAEMGLSAEISVKQDGEESVELGLEGEGLGLLIGPKGATLLALQDLTRTVVQRKTGASNGRLWVDVSSYRQKRSAALARFAQQVAAQVVASGARKAMEPMSAADRKVVHDTVGEIPGVATLSEGEDANRRVVVYAVAD